MNKKLLLVLLFIMMLFILQGCKRAQEENPSAKADDPTTAASMGEENEESNPSGNLASAAITSNSDNISTANAVTGEAGDGDASLEGGTQLALQKGTSLQSSDNNGQEESYQEDKNLGVEDKLGAMTMEQKAAQLFIVLPEAVIDADVVTEAGSVTQQAIKDHPVGGFVYMEQNLQDPDQVKAMLSKVQEYSQEAIHLPMFTCVDEEGGTVARINGNANFSGLPGCQPIPDMSDVGNSGDEKEALEVGRRIGAYLHELGFNLDFAPVADVLSNPANQVVQERSFGSDPQLVASMSLAVAKGLEENGVFGTFKHFPGHGATEGDTHEGYAYTSKSLDQLEECELIPFQQGIDAGVDFIMAGHISLPAVLGDNTPASLSGQMLTDILRNEMGYEGIIVTDAMNMGAITQSYSSGEAAVAAIQAGADIILMPEDFTDAYQGVLDAINNQSLSEERIDESVRRILEKKAELMEGQQ